MLIAIIFAVTLAFAYYFSGLLMRWTRDVVGRTCRAVLILIAIIFAVTLAFAPVFSGLLVRWTRDVGDAAVLKVFEAVKAALRVILIREEG